MKWQNKGHEFDELGNKFKEIKKIVFIGDDFNQTHYYIDKSIKDFLNFLDVKIEFVKLPKIFLKHRDLMKFAVSFINLKEKKAIIVPHYHYSEMTLVYKLCEYLKSKYPEKLIFSTNEFFEKYLSIFSVYSKDKTYVRDTCIIVTTVCTLNCKYCLNFTPFLQNPAPISLEKLKEEADVYFKSVDKVGFFQISGGEPLSYKQLGKYIEWLAQTYSSKIGQILLATNGTLIPDEKLTKILKKYNVILLLDNYTKAVPRTQITRDKLIKHLENNHIDFRNYEKEQEFFKFFPAAEDYSKWSDEELAERAEKCWGLQPWHNLRKGKVFYCCFSSLAVTAGIIQDNPANYYDLNSAVDKKELAEFLLGFSELGYDTFCKLCNGISAANTLERDIAGFQAKKKYLWHEGMTLAEYEEITRD